jgi:ribonuclease P protein component
MEEKLLTAEENKAENALQQPKSLKFPKAARLLHKRQFQKILREGRRFSGETVSIQFISKTSALPPKLGITVSRKFGKAHDRNRFKRIVREAFRELSDRLPLGTEIHILPKLRSHLLRNQDILNDLTKLPLKTTKT